MKYILLSISLLFLSFGSCKKEESPEPKAPNPSPPSTPKDYRDTYVGTYQCVETTSSSYMTVDPVTHQFSSVTSTNTFTTEVYVIKDSISNNSLIIDGRTIKVDNTGRGTEYMYYSVYFFKDSISISEHYGGLGGSTSSSISGKKM